MASKTLLLLCLVVLSRPIWSFPGKGYMLFAVRSIAEKNFARGIDSSRPREKLFSSVAQYASTKAGINVLCSLFFRGQIKRSIFFCNYLCFKCLRYF